jgi:hypothetical protein
MGWNSDWAVMKEMYQNQAEREGRGKDLLSRLGLGIRYRMIDGRGVD